MNEQETKQAEKKAVNDLNQASKISDESYFSYLKNLTTVATGLLGLLVSLKSSEATSITSKYLFVITILFLGLGIVLSMITQYKEVYDNKIDFKYKMKSFIKGNYKKEIWDYESDYTPPIKLFSKTEKFSYICLALAFITLIVYVFSIEFQVFV